MNNFDRRTHDLGGGRAGVILPLPSNDMQLDAAMRHARTEVSGAPYTPDLIHVSATGETLTISWDSTRTRKRRLNQRTGSEARSA